eukprot:1194872-Prorocentrum_minimum.AAC.4
MSSACGGVRSPAYPRICLPKKPPITPRARNCERGCVGGGSGGSQEGVRRGFDGQVWTPVSLRTRLKVKSTRAIFKVCCTSCNDQPKAITKCVVQYKRGTNIQNATYQRCEHPGLPGASSVCKVRIPWTNPSPIRGTGEQRGKQRMGVAEGVCGRGMWRGAVGGLWLGWWGPLSSGTEGGGKYLVNIVPIKAIVWAMCLAT